MRARTERLAEETGLACVAVSQVAEASRDGDDVFLIVVVESVFADADCAVLCAAVRKHARDGRSYVLLRSALEDDVAKGLAAGADDSLSAQAPDSDLLRQLKVAFDHVRHSVRCNRIQISGRNQFKSVEPPLLV